MFFSGFLSTRTMKRRKRVSGYIDILSAPILMLEYKLEGCDLLVPWRNIQHRNSRLPSRWILFEKQFRPLLLWRNSNVCQDRSFQIPWFFGNLRYCIHMHDIFQLFLALKTYWLMISPKVYKKSQLFLTEQFTILIECDAWLFDIQLFTLFFKK